MSVGCADAQPAVLVFRVRPAYRYCVDGKPQNSTAPKAGIWKLLDTLSGRIAVLAAIVVGLGTIAGGVFGTWGWITSRFEDEPPLAQQSGDIAPSSADTGMYLKAYLKTHPTIDREAYTGFKLAALGVQVRVTIHLIGFGRREVLIRVSDPNKGFLGAASPFEAPADDYRGEVDNWVPYSTYDMPDGNNWFAQAYIELRDGDRILDSFKTKRFSDPRPVGCAECPPFARPPRKLLAPVVVASP